MRLNWPPPWDLVASVLISVFTLAIVLLSPESVLTYSAPLGLLLVVLLPGHLLSFCLFPAGDAIEPRRPALLSLGLSAAVVALVGLGLSLTPRGLQPASLVTMLSLLALFLAAASYLRWSALPRRKRSAAGRRRSLKNAGQVPIPAKNHLAVLFLILAAVLAIATFALDANRFQSPSLDTGFTEFDVSWPGGAANTRAYSLAAGATGSAMVQIINHEHAPVNYSLQLVHNNTILLRKDVSLGNNQSWQEPAGFQLVDTASPGKLDFLLFRDGNFIYPYREAHLWVNVMENQSNEPNNSSQVDISRAIDDSEESNVSANKPAAIADQESRIVVLGLGDKGSHSSSGSSSPKQSQKVYQESRADHDLNAADRESEQESEPDQENMLKIDASEESTREGGASGNQVSDDSNEPQINQPEPEKQENLAEAPKASSLQEENLSPETVLQANAAESGPSVAPQSGEKKTSDAPNGAQESGTDAGEPKSEPGISAPATAAASSPSGGSGKVDAPGDSQRAAVSQEDKSKPAAINREINSWVGTRGITSSAKAPKSYQSQNIRYVRDDKGERAVLGRSAANAGAPAQSRSQEPRRLG